MAYYQQQRGGYGHRGGGFRGRGGGYRGRGNWRGNWRGPPRGGMGGPPRPPAPHQFIPHVPFDFVICEKSFPRIRPDLEEEDILRALTDRDNLIRPVETTYHELKTLHDKIVAGIQAVQQTDTSDGFVTGDIDPEDFKILEFHTIGSFTRNCLLKNNMRVDVALIISTLPTHETVGQVSRQVLNKMKQSDPSCDQLLLNSNDYGFDIMKGDELTVAVWLTIPFERLPELCPGTHISPELCQLAQRAIKHTQWYSSTVQGIDKDTEHAPLLTRIFRDLRERFPGFSSINKWVADLLVAHCIMNNPKAEETGKLSPPKVMRRLLQLLASGIFLPHSVGLTDPTEQGYRVHQDWSPNDMDSVCTTAQTLLRVWCHGGHRAVLGLENNTNIDTQLSIWNDIVVTPSEFILKQT